MSLLGGKLKEKYIPLRIQIVIVIHFFASLLGWVQFFMALNSGDYQVSILALAVGCYGLGFTHVVFNQTNRE